MSRNPLLLEDASSSARLYSNGFNRFADETISLNPSQDFRMEFDSLGVGFTCRWTKEKRWKTENQNKIEILNYNSRLTWYWLTHHHSNVGSLYWLCSLATLVKTKHWLRPYHPKLHFAAATECDSVRNSKNSKWLVLFFAPKYIFSHRFERSRFSSGTFSFRPWHLVFIGDHNVWYIIWFYFRFIFFTFRRNWHHKNHSGHVSGFVSLSPFFRCTIQINQFKLDNRTIRVFGFTCDFRPKKNKTRISEFTICNTAFEQKSTRINL